jgi:hypothetical protein
MSIQQVSSNLIGSLATTKLTGRVPVANANLGAVLQVAQAYKSDTFSMSSTTPADITGLSVSITPSSTNSRILVLVTVSIGTTNNNFGFINLVRGSTNLFLGDAAAGRKSVSGMGFPGAYNIGVMETVSIFFVDSPASASALTYKVQASSGVNGNLVFVNRSSRDQAATDYDSRQASSIIVMEIAG